jgi:hypothetical protein
MATTLDDEIGDDDADDEPFLACDDAARTISFLKREGISCV